MASEQTLLAVTRCKNGGFQHCETRIDPKHFMGQALDKILTNLNEKVASAEMRLLPESRALPASLFVRLIPRKQTIRLISGYSSGSGRLPVGLKARIDRNTGAYSRACGNIQQTFEAIRVNSQANGYLIAVDFREKGFYSSICYKTQLFSRETAKRMADDFIKVARSTEEVPTKTVIELAQDLFGEYRQSTADIQQKRELSDA